MYRNGSHGAVIRITAVTKVNQFHGILFKELMLRQFIKKETEL